MVAYSSKTTTVTCINFWRRNHVCVTFSYATSPKLKKSKKIAMKSDRSSNLVAQNHSDFEQLSVFVSLYFQSNHSTADFHGVARAIGGCSVYVRWATVRNEIRFHSYWCGDENYHMDLSHLIIFATTSQDNMTLKSSENLCCLMDLY